jgi:8-oxo-dGTP pyrophosphatase MutT (NUDIX family)
MAGPGGEGALFILVDGEGRLLLQLRGHGPGVRRPGVWAVPGGSIEDGESAEEAALREVREETGQPVEPLYFVGRERRGEDTVHVFCGGARFPEERIVVGEGQAFRFFRGDEIERLKPISPNAGPLVRAFLAHPLYERCQRDARAD